MSGYRLNKMAMSLIEPANRQAFVVDPAGYMRGHELDDAAIALVERRDWNGLIGAGGNVYLMLKIAGTLGVSLMDMGAAMRRGAEARA